MPAQLAQQDAEIAMQLGEIWLKATLIKPRNSSNRGPVIASSAICAPMSMEFEATGQ